MPFPDKSAEKAKIPSNTSGGACDPDYESMECIRARLVRKTTCSNGCKCDYTICGDCDASLREHPEYRDEAGYRRNK